MRGAAEGPGASASGPEGRAGAALRRLDGGEVTRELVMETILTDEDRCELSRYTMNGRLVLTLEDRMSPAVRAIRQGHPLTSCAAPKTIPSLAFGATSDTRLGEPGHPPALVPSAQCLVPSHKGCKSCGLTIDELASLDITGCNSTHNSVVVQHDTKATSAMTAVAVTTAGGRHDTHDFPRDSRPASLR